MHSLDSALHDHSPSAEGQPVSKLAVVEDPEGWHVAGLRSRLARNSAELAQIFEAGCQARDHGYMDLGSVHERTAAIFTIRLAQFNPAVDAEDEDAATVGLSACTGKCYCQTVKCIFMFMCRSRNCSTGTSKDGACCMLL